MATNTRLTISIDTCLTHRSFFSIAVNQGGGGRRLTPSKCCGQWHEINAWSMSPDDLDAMAAVLTDTAAAARAAQRVCKVE